MSKKRVLMSYMEYEGNALQGYLEEMALKGWKLEKIGNLFLTFESTKPHSVRYSVELMEGTSVYDSVQTPGQKGYREFCQEEGWEYVGTNGLLHVFRTENMEALPVETDDQIRYERILKGNAGNKKMVGIVFGIVTLLNLFACYTRGSLWNSNGFCVLILLGFAAYYMINAGLWKQKAKRSMEQTGKLPKQDWRQVSRKNNLVLGIVFVIFLLVVLHLASRAGGKIFGIVLVIYLAFYISLIFIFSRLLKWLREKQSFSRGTNIAIYWGVAVLAIVIGVAASLLLIRCLI